MTPRTLLFVMAHGDDECFFSPRILRAVEGGDEVYCAYTTDGSAQGTPAAVKVRESTRAMARLGVAAERLLFPGVEEGFADGASHRKIDEVHAAMVRNLEGIDADEVYLLAWEGGHIDHDVSHLAGAAWARARGIEAVYECPAYNRHEPFPYAFRVMTWIPRGLPIQSCRLRLGEAVRLVSLLTSYRSQWKTFLGLGPGIVSRLVLRRRHEWRSTAGLDYSVRPHAGPLLYETRFGIPYFEFRQATAAFVDRHLSG